MSAAAAIGGEALWRLDAIINRRGFYVDLDLAKATRKIVHAEQEAIDAEITELTGGRITSINQVAKLQALLGELGHDVSGLTKKSVSAALAHKPEGDVKRLLELRQEGAQAAARKLDSLLAGIDADQRMRGTLRYHGASTGRWSGARFQPQNLKKAKTENLDAAIDAIRAGDLGRLRRIGAPLAIAGDVSRNMIVAAPGHVLIGADFSAVESRVLAWIADETWKLDAYRRFDETGDPAAEPYCVTASKILQACGDARGRGRPPDRQDLRSRLRLRRRSQRVAALRFQRYLHRRPDRDFQGKMAQHPRGHRAFLACTRG